jgi:hypothetical protein
VHTSTIRVKHTHTDGEVKRFNGEIKKFQNLEIQYSEKVKPASSISKV